MKEEEKSADFLEKLRYGIVMFFTFFYHILVASVKAFLPCGVVPRKSVQGEIVLITGSGSGLGRLTAIQFGKLGARLVLWDVNVAGNAETQNILKSQGVESHTYTVDVSKREAIYAAAEKVRAEVGDVDILVNNAGIVTGKRIFDCPDELMQKTMDINATALFWTTKAFVPQMLARNHGHVVTIASLAGHCVANKIADYCASKHAAVGFSEALRAEIAVAGKNVPVTVICPFFINTGMFDGIKISSEVVMPLLEPEFVVDRIMEAILTEAEHVLLPKSSYSVLFLNSFLPKRAAAVIADVFGFNQCMDAFKGRSNDNNNNNNNSIADKNNNYK